MATRPSMNLNQPVRIAPGIATSWYALYLLITLAGLILLAAYAGLALLVVGESNLTLRLLLRKILSMEAMLRVHPCSLLLEVGLLIFYLAHTITNTKARTAVRMTLGVRHLFMPFVAMPEYHLLYIWPDHPPAWAVADREARPAFSSDPDQSAGS